MCEAIHPQTYFSKTKIAPNHLVHQSLGPAFRFLRGINWVGDRLGKGLCKGTNCPSADKMMRFSFYSGGSKTEPVQYLDGHVFGFRMVFGF